MRHIFRSFFCYTFFQCIKAFSWNLLATYRYQELPVPQTSTLGTLKVAESVYPDCTFKLTSQRTDIKNFSWSTCGQMISKEKYIFNFHFDWVRHKKKKKIQNKCRELQTRNIRQNSRNSQKAKLRIFIHLNLIQSVQKLLFHDKKIHICQATVLVKVKVLQLFTFPCFEV